MHRQVTAAERLVSGVKCVAGEAQHGGDGRIYHDELLSVGAISFGHGLTFFTKNWQLEW
jgi:hypothetical protein